MVKNFETVYINSLVNGNRFKFNIYLSEIRNSSRMEIIIAIIDNPLDENTYALYSSMPTKDGFLTIMSPTYVIQRVYRLKLNNFSGGVIDFTFINKTTGIAPVFVNAQFNMIINFYE